ncbi:MAG TPA: glycosyl hydrolase [Parapedobacter sp.]|uniref:glycosyl hydrolase n=1 Tax=Parapedobacter sp. TaxID=1958893 RepID=UPI002CE8D6A5|nr:glycosyl hydrolase [Parapedobacter sp.]HWK57237.1 glycosyl hydrolase [Parapedobacter sp.]
MKHTRLGLLVVLGLAACTVKRSPLADEFRQPAMAYRPNLNIHGYPDEPEKQDGIIAEYLLNGYGGMATNANWTDGYLKDETEMKSLFRFATEARSKGMNVWLYDENWYPSGMAGGYILEEHPEWEAEGLLFKDSVLTGPRGIQLPLLPGKLMAIKAVPVEKGINRLDRTEDVSNSVRDGVLHWQVSAGTWRIVQVATNVLRDGFQAGTDRGGKERYYPSLLLPQVGERFIELTHKRYAEVLGEKLDNLFYATFTDEPSSMAHSFQNLGYGVYPWKQNVSDTLLARFNWSLKDKLTTLLLDEDKEGQQLRYQYFSVIRDLMRDNYFKAIKAYCATQGIKSSGHLLLEESLPIQALLYGDIMACFREMDIPGIDVLTAMPEFTRRYLYSARLAASVAELNGSSEVMSEICPVADPPHRDGKEASTIEAKGTVNRQLVGGVTRFNNYLQLEHASQAEKYAFNTYVARISALFSHGHRAAKVAVLYPIETIWTKSRPVPAWNKSWDDMAGGTKEVIETATLFDNISDHLYDHHWEFSYLDVQGILDATVANGKLCHGKLSWEVLVLPQVETIPAAALAVIDAFVEAGGKVIAVGHLPENSDMDFPSEPVKRLSATLFSDGGSRSKNTIRLHNYDESTFEEALSTVLTRDYTIEPMGLPVLASHKKINGDDVLLVANDSDGPLEFRVRFPSEGDVSLWDPNSGDINETSRETTIKLAPYDAIVVRKTQ